MLRTIKLFTILTFLIISSRTMAQCTASEGEVTIVVHTDDYGYEAYWQLVPNGNGCGNGTIAEGGNLTIGCSGAGLQNQDPGGYGNNLDITEGPWCLPLGNQYDLYFIDDWGDGGINFDILVNGYQIGTFEGMGLGGVYTFTVQEPPLYDLSMFGSNVYSYMPVGTHDLHVHTFNSGSATITSYDVNYSVNGGPVQTHSVTGSSLANYESEEINHSVPLNVPSNGVYTIKIWADNINGGNADMNNSNDTLTKIYEAGPGIPNYLDGYIGQTVSIEQVAGTAEQVASPMDLDFHPVFANNQLWVINRGTENSGGSTVIIDQAGEPTQTSQYKQDGNAWHFMSLPTGMAFGRNGNWASSPGVYDANHNGGDAFTGPTLWSGDLSVYAEPSGGNGSHLDMLHLSPYSQGIAAERDNVYWVFDGYSSDIVRYDFAEDHGPGASYHGDGIVRRYADDAVAKDPNNVIASHLEMDDSLKWLYVVDHGNQRVIRIDITTGADLGGTPSYPMNEAIAEYSVITGYTQETVVTGLDKPVGIDIIDDRMIISEYQTGEIIMYDISSMPAVELERISTGMTSVQGIKIGPDGKIWFVDQTSNGVYRINAPGLGLVDQQMALRLYPNPSSGEINISLNNAVDGTLRLINLQGQILLEEEISGFGTKMIADVAAGTYLITLMSKGQLLGTETVIIR